MWLYVPIWLGLTAFIGVGLGVVIAGIALVPVRALERTRGLKVLSAILRSAAVLGVALAFVSLAASFFVRQPSLFFTIPFTVSLIGTVLILALTIRRARTLQRDRAVDGADSSR